MNIGQILETHLGWASASLGRQVSEMIRKMKNEGHTNDLKNKLLQIYEQANHKDKINKMSLNADAKVTEIGSQPFGTMRYDKLDNHSRPSKLDADGNINSKSDELPF